MITIRRLKLSNHAILISIAGFCLGLAAYTPSIAAWFSAEELTGIFIVRHDPFNLWSGRGGPGFFRPVIPMILWVWHYLFGLEPRPYHLLNLTVHLLNTCLVYSVARGWTRLLPESHRLRSSTAAGAAALLFWVWPSHSEPVSWIPALTDVAAAVWALSSIAAYLRYRNGGSWGWALGAVLLYIGGLCTKESVITLPAAIFAYEIMRALLLRKWRARDFLFPMAFAVVFFNYFLFSRGVTGAFLGGYGTGVHSDFSWTRMRYTLTPNLANAFLPLPGLNANQTNLLMLFFALVCATAIFWRSSRNFRKAAGNQSESATVEVQAFRYAILPIMAMAVAAVLIFLPGLNLVIGHITDGQRFSYLASALAVISVAYTAAYALPSGRWFLAIVGLLAIACAGLLATYNTNWYNAGKIARKGVRGMKDLPPARKLYVLTTTGSYHGAFVLPHSLDLISQMMLKTPREGQIIMAGTVRNWTPQTDVRVNQTHRDGAIGYLVRLENEKPDAGPAPRLEPLSGPSDVLAAIKLEGETLYVQPRDFDPTLDKVVWLDGGTWEQL